MHPDISKSAGVWRRVSEVMHAAWDVTEDRDGNLVVATWGGVCLMGASTLRYLRKDDGLVCTEAHRVFRDSRGDLWIGTLRGASRYDGRTFVNFTAENGLAGDNVRSFFEDRQGRIWMGARRGVSCFDRDQLRDYSLDSGGLKSRVNSICEDALGLLWFATRDGLYTFDGIQFRHIHGPGFSRKESRAVFCDSTGTLWLSWPQRGVFRYVEGRLKPCLVEGRPILLVNDIMEDRQGVVWFGTQEGVFFFNGTRAERLNPQGAPGSLQPNRLYLDRANRLWFPSGVGGLLMLDPCAVAGLSADNTSSGVLARCRGSKGFWWCNGGSLVRYVEEERIEVAKFDSGIVRFLEDGEGRLWVITAYQRLYRGEKADDLNRPKFLDVTDDLNLPAGTRLESLAEDGRGCLWIGHGRGVIRFDGQRYEPAAWTDGSGCPVECSANRILWDGNDVCWISDGEVHGLVRYNGTMFRRFTVEDGLLHNRVGQTLMDSRGRLWIATVMGVNCYDGLSFKGYPIDDGLIPGLVNHMMEDHRGQIWFATTNGIVRFDGEEFQRLTEADGLPCDVTTGVVEDPDGKSVLIGTDLGVCRYTPDEVTRPAIHIEEVEAGGRYLRPTEVRVTAETMAVRIVFHGSCLRTRRLRYRYRLEGVDNGWTSTWLTEAWYENLPEGQYRFHVVAVNRDLMASACPAECRLIVKKDLRDHKIDILEKEVAEQALQLERERALREERARIARDIHDDVGAGLTHVAFLSELAQRDLVARPMELQGRLEQIRQVTTELTQSVDEIVWALNPTNDRVDNFLPYLAQYADEFLRTADVPIRVDLPEMSMTVTVSTRIRHHLFLALREALNNLVKHARPCSARLRLEVLDQEVCLELADDGPGFDSGIVLKGKVGHDGLASMRHRLQDVGGTADIVSSPGKGTNVILRVRILP